MSIAIFVSDRCSNCNRFLSTVRRIPSLQSARVVDVGQNHVPDITHVPTLVDTRGTRHVGSKAFEWLKRFEGEIEIEPMQLGSKSLSFGDINKSGEYGYAETFYSV